MSSRSSRTPILPSPVRSARRRSQTHLLSQSSSLIRASKADFTCVPKHLAASVQRNATPLHHYSEEDTLKLWGFKCPRKEGHVHVPSHIQEEQQYQKQQPALIENSTLKQCVFEYPSKDGHSLEPSHSKAVQQYQKPIPKESRRINLWHIIYIAPLITLMLASGFLGAACYAYMHHHYFQDNKYILIDNYSRDVAMKDGRISRLDVKIQRMSSSVSSLIDEINSLHGRISKPLESDTDVITTPPKGILEELFSSEPDLACAGNFGSILATPDTNSHVETASLSVLGLLAFDVHLPHRPPQTTIQGLIQEMGDCWAFEGHQGRLVLRLIRPSLLASVSVSHIPRSLSPTGDIHSAPRRFQVLVHHSEEDFENGIVLGEFEYDKTGPWRQSFRLNPPPSEQEEMFEVVEFRFLSNHGHPNYTCVYRVHVHGTMLFV